MKKMIGRKIMQACTIVEAHGSCTGAVAQPIMDMAMANTFKCMSRAVGLGLLTVDRSSRPHHWVAVTGWRDKVALIQREKPYVVRPAKVPYVPGKCDLQSVWGQP